MSAVREAGPGTPLRILVVEDDPEAREALADALMDAGHSVESCGNVPTAQRLVESFKPDAVLVDVLLPVFDGNELAATIRRTHANPPRLIAITGLPGGGAARDLFDEVLKKPVSWDRLEQALHPDGAASAPEPVPPVPQAAGKRHRRAIRARLPLHAPDTVPPPDPTPHVIEIEVDGDDP